MGPQPATGNSQAEGGKNSTIPKGGESLQADCCRGEGLSELSCLGAVWMSLRMCTWEIYNGLAMPS